MEFWKTASKRSGSRMGVQIYAEDIHSLWMDKGIDDHFREKFSKEIEELFDWKIIKESIENEPSFEDPGGEERKETYISTFLHLSPSGKYWTFWANGNMIMKEMVIDTIFWEVFNEVLIKHGMYYNCGEGDANDIFFGLIP